MNPLTKDEQILEEIVDKIRAKETSLEAIGILANFVESTNKEQREIFANQARLLLALLDGTKPIENEQTRL